MQTQSLFWMQTSTPWTHITAGTYVGDDRTLENHMRGLPKHVKEKVEAEMTKRSKMTPQHLWEKHTHEEEDKHTFVADDTKLHMRICRRNKKVDDQFFTSTV